MPSYSGFILTCIWLYPYIHIILCCITFMQLYDIMQESIMPLEGDNFGNSAVSNFGVGKACNGIHKETNTKY